MRKTILFISVLLIMCWSCKSQYSVFHEQVASQTLPTTIIADSSVFRYLSKSEQDYYYWEKNGLILQHLILRKGDTARIFIDKPVLLHTGVDETILKPGGNYTISIAEDMVLEVRSNDKQTNNDLLFVKAAFVWAQKKAYNFYRPYNIGFRDSISQDSALMQEQLILNHVKAVNNVLPAIIDSFKQIYHPSYEVAEVAQVRMDAINTDLIVQWYLARKEMLAEMGIKGLKMSMVDTMLSSVQNTRLLGCYNWVMGNIIDIFKPYLKSSNDAERLENVVVPLSEVNKYYSGLRRQHLAIRLLMNADRQRLIVPDSLIKISYTYMDEPAYREILRTIEKRQKVLAKKSVDDQKGINVLYSFRGKQFKNLQQIIGNYEGKLVLVDFWASWCMPCAALLPAQRSLELKLAGKDIEFINVSTDGNQQNWKKAVLSEAMDQDRSYVFVNAKVADFLSTHEIKGVPRYVLFGRKGELINIDCPKPNDSLLLKLIKQELEKKK